MKKLLTSLFLASALGFGTLSADQVYFEDNFESGLGKWTTVDGDGFNLHQEAYEAMGLSATKTISWDAVKVSSTNSVALSSSYYNPKGKANDWLISPEFEIGEKAVLEWTANAYMSNYPDGYKVYISTTGGDTTNFTQEIFSIEAENGDATKRYINLTDLNFKNQKIRIAFRNVSEDKFFLFLDDVIVHVPVETDLQLLFAQTPEYFKKGTSDAYTFPIYVLNNSFYNTINSFDLSYQADGEEAVKATITSPGIGYNEYGLFKISTPWNPTTLGNRTITFTISNINGTNETDATPADNIFTSNTIVWDNTIATDLFPLYESFTSSTCVPCANIGKTLNPILDATADKMSLIKYQMSWPLPGDPYYNADGELRKTFYGVNSVPMAFANGSKYSFTNTSLTQAGLNQTVLNRPGYFDIVNPTYTINDNKVTVNVELKGFADLTGKVLTAHIGVFEFKTTGNKSSNGETEFHHVMQKMLPNGNGTKVTALTKDAVQPLSYEYEFTTTDHVEEMDDLGVVVFVQENSSKTILQSAYAVKTGPNSVPYVEDGNGVVGLYPNPAKESAQLKYSIKGDKNVTVELFDLAGNSVYFADKGLLSTGYYNENFDLASIANGQYFVRLNIGGRMFTDVINVVK